MFDPSFTEVGALKVAVGSTLVTVMVLVAVPLPPSSSVTTSVTT